MWDDLLGYDTAKKPYSGCNSSHAFQKQLNLYTTRLNQQTIDCEHLGENRRLGRAYVGKMGFDQQFCVRKR